jgi:uncharacterized membrane protein
MNSIFFVTTALVAVFVLATVTTPVLAQNATTAGGNATGGNATGGNTTSAATSAGPTASEGGGEGEEGEEYNEGGN